MTDGNGAEAVVDFVGEKGATADGVAMLRDGGSYYVIGYGENVDVPTIDIISREINFVGNLVGTYNDLAELMTLQAQGKVTLHTNAYPLQAINDALDDLDNGRVRGRGILVPAAAAACPRWPRSTGFTSRSPTYPAPATAARWCCCTRALARWGCG